MRYCRAGQIAWATGLLVSMGTLVRAGPYSPAGGQPGSTAIKATDPSIVEWATGAMIDRGLVEIDKPALGNAFYGGLTGGTYSVGTATYATSNNAPIGEPPQPQTTSYAVALGQGGMATLTFAKPITNGPGYDFAVFGNGFSSGTLEWVKPAFVEVSSDGIDFFRFPSVSLTPSTTQVSSYGQLDPTNLGDLAGKDPAGWGTPFDLSELAGVSPLLNVNDVTEVRIIDCVGDISAPYASEDSLGNVVNAPWPAYSAVGSEGFGLAGVGVINAAPEPGTLSLAIAALAAGAVWIRRRCATVP